MDDRKVIADEFQLHSKDRQKDIVRDVMRELGASPRQMVRVCVLIAHENGSRSNSRFPSPFKIKDQQPVPLIDFKGIPDFRQTRIAMLRAETMNDLLAILEETRAKLG